MKLLGRTFRISDVAAIVTWAIVSGIVVYMLQSALGRYEGLLGPTVALQLLNLAAMLVVASHEKLPYEPRSRWLALAVQLASALTLGWMLPIGFLQIYTIIWLAMAASFVPFRLCVVFFVALMLTWYGIEAWIWEDEDALFQVLLFGTFHYFAMFSSIEAKRAQRAREDAQALNQELIATQHLLSEASRQSERTRIARDLHDLLGHHLTALSINLQVAARMTEGPARETIEQSHALSRLLLSDVREAVSALREESAVDFTRALRLTIANIPRLKIHLDVADDLRIDDVTVADSLLRCVQEAITNTLRHSGATESWVRVWREDGRLNMQIRDNGVVADPLKWGNGLTGMHERIERIRGSLSVARVRRAVEINIHVPGPA